MGTTDTVSRPEEATVWKVEVQSVVLVAPFGSLVTEGSQSARSEPRTSARFASSA